MKLRVPKKGEKIFVYPGDNFCGGWAIVDKVIPQYHGKDKVHGIIVRENPKMTYYWERGLGEEQEKLSKQYGNEHACLQREAYF